MRVYLQAGGETQEVLIEPHMTVSTVKERFVALNLVKGLLLCDLELTFAGMRLSNPVFFDFYINTQRKECFLCIKYLCILIFALYPNVCSRSKTEMH